MNRYREKRPDCTIIHFEGASADDRTLCGVAFEGACLDGDDFPLERVESGKVNCSHCIEIVHWCSKVNRRLIETRHQFGRPR